jgi:drug/metabolite transporter (DMT)-like permease
MNIYLVIFITLIASLLASLSQILFKTGMAKRLRSLSDMILQLKNRRVLLGLFGYGSSLVVYLYALSNSPLSIVYPVFASTFIFVALLSSIFLKERISALRATGIAVIFFGIALVAMTI